ncbi:MAG: YggT family protein [Proteobacteria bacterium]|nr:YggT family protein [Pseudomonadota bacterium]
MFIVSNLLIAIGEIIKYVLTIYNIILIIRVFISWVSASPYNPIVRIVYVLTEPVLKPVRRIIPPINVGMVYLDLSPLIVFFVLHFLNSFLVRTIYDLALRIRG